MSFPAHKDLDNVFGQPSNMLYSPALNPLPNPTVLEHHQASSTFPQQLQVQGIEDPRTPHYPSSLEEEPSSSSNPAKGSRGRPRSKKIRKSEDAENAEDESLDPDDKDKKAGVDLCIICNWELIILPPPLSFFFYISLDQFFIFTILRVLSFIRLIYAISFLHNNFNTLLSNTSYSPFIITVTVSLFYF